MNSASKQIITRCPKCGTAFRVTPTQLQSAKGAVRCGSCLHVFKAQDYIVAGPQPTTALPGSSPTTQPTTLSTEAAKTTEAGKPAKNPTPTAAVTTPQKPIAPLPPVSKPAPIAEPAILSAIKLLDLDQSVAPPTVKKAATPQVKKPVIRVIDKSSLAQADDILISDDMDDKKSDAKTYDCEDLMELDMTPVSDVSLFERKIRNKDEQQQAGTDADESWAEMLIDDEDDDTPQLGVIKPKTDEQLADEELHSSYAFNTEIDDERPHAPTPITPTTPGLMFSLVGEKEEKPTGTLSGTLSGTTQTSDDFVISDELARIPNNQGFNNSPDGAANPLLDPSLLETPNENADDSPKRQLNTQPKMRAYDGSRTALLMNIMPAPIEFTAKRMRRWYQRKLWPSLSLLALVALIIQIGWFKFDYFSRAEPYRTGYLFLCPYIGCQVPTLVDTSRIMASNLVVREIPETPGALSVDVMIINNAPFEQPYPDLILAFTDINEKQVATRRFTPKEYLAGEVAGQHLMPQNTKVHISLDMVDPGPEAVNYHIDIPH
jgi:predicted Zn finger-like uncharacterized protein